MTARVAVPLQAEIKDFLILQALYKKTLVILLFCRVSTNCTHCIRGISLYGLDILLYSSLVATNSPTSVHTTYTPNQKGLKQLHTFDFIRNLTCNTLKYN